MSSTTETISLTNEKENTEQVSIKKLFRIRKYLLILVIIQWILCFINLVMFIYSVITENEDNISNRIKSSIPLFILTFYYTFGLLVIYKYYRIGILIFASVGDLLFIVTSLFIGGFFYLMIMISLEYNSMSTVFELFLFFGVIFGIFAGIVILTLTLAFNLAQLIKINGYTSV
ncbi:unnamed protein product [Rotaria sordida]|uniref:Uncharacterized protein n=1 Tax=Rotaria sordida TaxID=392033 RepID=A0A814UNQ0_9BILA|nr:unnamed protein product [Rotaria sordida]CAF1435557.1 unnamed protein product [Rotaria sordida]